MTFREPLGVVGLIVPWNFPLVIASWKLAPALAAGNTIVLKPAGLTPLTALELERIAREAGLPEGVLNVVAGPGSVCGQRLVEHPDVAKIAFTGSTEVGRGIAQAAADTIKRVTLELGGKSANVVFADADIEARRGRAPMAVFGNAGQDCCARSRILVERSALDDFMAALEGAVNELRVGDPLDEATQMGPLISADQRETVALVRGRRRTGGDPRLGPRRARRTGSRRRCCAPVSNDDRAARDEIFGPVACVIPFEGEDEAVRIANDTIYGLSGSIWTRDGARALRVARAIETGVLSINSNTSVRVSTPFGGFKQSGVGRELGPHALEHYTESRTSSSGPEGLMAGRLEGKVCVITGAGERDRGAPAAELFESEGANVVGVDLDATTRAATSRWRPTSPTRTRSRRCTRARARSSVASTCSSTTPGSPPTTTPRCSTRSLEAWQRVQDVNLKSVFLCCKHGIPHLLDAGGGSVINTASFVAVMGAATSQISYTASKGGVLALSRELGVEFARARRARQRALPRAGQHAAARRSCSPRTPSRPAASRPRADRPLRRARARSPTARCSWPATSRRS